MPHGHIRGLSQFYADGLERMEIWIDKRHAAPLKHTFFNSEEEAATNLPGYLAAPPIIRIYRMFLEYSISPLMAENKQCGFGRFFIKMP